MRPNLVLSKRRRPSVPILAAGLLAALAACVAARSPSPPAASSPQAQTRISPGAAGRFRFVRLKYACASPRCNYFQQIPSWEHGFPTSEQHLLQALNGVLSFNARPDEMSVIAIDDPALSTFPIAYMAEASFWQTTSHEAAALGAYLRGGGFLINDDFREDVYRGSGGWAAYEANMAQALPGLHFIDCTPDMPIFHAYYQISSFDQIPQDYDRGRPIFRALFEDNDPHKRMLVIANFNTDLSNFWEFEAPGQHTAAAPNGALQLGVNYIVYGLSH